MNSPADFDASPSDSELSNSDQHWMRQALNLAAKGEGRVEPNPMVGCVLVKDDQLLGAGFHSQFGGPHAEVAALADAAQGGKSVESATAYVTLEPCSHFGKTPPCADALIKARVSRVVIAVEDPFSQVSGKGIGRLKENGIEVAVGILEQDARILLAPYIKRIEQKLPWVIAKWAMTLDGKIATSSGDSRWISGEGSRAWVHQLRGRMDGILVGSGTALADDPMLTVRPAGLRTPKRLLLDRTLRLPLDSKLVATAKDIPVIVAAAHDAEEDRVAKLMEHGVQVWRPENAVANFSYASWVREFLTYLADTGMTNILVEGGAAVLGNLADQQLIDEVAVFVAPKVVGGSGAGPIGGNGVLKMADCQTLQQASHQIIGSDVLIRGRVKR